MHSISKLFTYTLDPKGGQLSQRAVSHMIAGKKNKNKNKKKKQSAIPEITLLEFYSRKVQKERVLRMEWV